MTRIIARRTSGQDPLIEFGRYAADRRARLWQTGVCFTRSANTAIRARQKSLDLQRNLHVMNYAMRNKIVCMRLPGTNTAQCYYLHNPERFASVYEGPRA